MTKNNSSNPDQTATSSDNELEHLKKLNRPLQD